MNFSNHLWLNWLTYSLEDRAFTSRLCYTVPMKRAFVFLCCLLFTVNTAAAFALPCVMTMGPTSNLVDNMDQAEMAVDCHSAETTNAEADVPSKKQCCDSGCQCAQTCAAKSLFDVAAADASAAYQSTDTIVALVFTVSNRTLDIPSPPPKA